MLNRHIPSNEWRDTKRPSSSNGTLRLLKILLVLCLIYTLVMFVRNAIQVPVASVDSRLVTLPTPSLSGQMREASSKQADEKRLLGETGEQQVSETAQAGDVPDTPLNLVLRGTFSSVDSHLTYAIIAGPSGAEENYTVGDPVPGGGTVHEIMADRVVLLRDQYHETLYIVRDDGQDSAVTAVRLTSAGDPEGQSSFDERPVFKGHRKSLIDFVQPQPVRVDGKFVGFRLKPLKNQSLLYESGLQQGDVVTWINEVYMDNPLKGMRTLRSISSGDYVNMTVRRNGQDFALSFHMPQ